MFRRIFQLPVLLMLATGFSTSSEGAEFSIIDPSPFRSTCWMAFITGTIQAGGSVRHAIPTCDDPQSSKDVNFGNYVDKRQFTRETSWQFWDTETNRPELGLDGAWSYEGIHDVAAVGALVNGPVILLEGQIEQGDAERFEAFLRENDLLECLAESYCPFQNALALNSPGGSLAEALKLAELVKKHNFPVLIPDEGTCASSCSFLFFAGYTEYEDFFHSRRFIHETGRLQVHRPRIDLQDRAFSAGEVTQIVGILDDVKEEAIRQFLQARIPRLVLLQMYETPAYELTTVPLAQMTGFSTVVGSAPYRGTLPDRTGVLSFCAYQYYGESGRMHPDLLKNLEVRDDSFVTWVDKGDFMCFGARGPQNDWKFDVCQEGVNFGCALVQYADNELPPGSFQLDGEFQYYGALLGAFSGRERHELVRNAIGWSGAFTRILPRWIDTATVPDAYCGQLDAGAPSSIRSLQTALNARGYDAGPVDGMMGGRTETALTAAARAAGAAYFGTLDAEILTAIGVPPPQIDAMRLCQ